MAKRFEISITKRRAWYYYTMVDRLNLESHLGPKGYNSEGGAKEAACLLADELLGQGDKNVYEYGPEL